ncbi:hypothetical protein [Rhodococcus sp. X156]|uniref:hypothetical protein n=1 Tax=Rhodococcus sp. X156 TaxID=2499145 RepID=UPI000FDB8D69|nr:hypothetical protein [Rhodococcus sp. X156]
MHDDAVLGTWDLALKTPIGTLKVQYLFERAGDGLRGTATGAAETVPLSDIEVKAGGGGGHQVTWRQSITKPMRLNLDFDVLVADGTMTGHSRAGRLPRSKVSGQRVVAA